MYKWARQIVLLVVTFGVWFLIEWFGWLQIMEPKALTILFVVVLTSIIGSIYGVIAALPPYTIVKISGSKLSTEQTKILVMVALFPFHLVWPFILQRMGFFMFAEIPWWGIASIGLIAGYASWIVGEIVPKPD